MGIQSIASISLYMLASFLLAINLFNIIDKTKTSLNIYGKNLFIPLRTALIGKEHGPDLYTIINILGKNESIERLKQ